MDAVTRARRASGITRFTAPGLVYCIIAEGRFCARLWRYRERGEGPVCGRGIFERFLRDGEINQWVSSFSGCDALLG